MSLDITILGPDGSPQHSVPVGVHSHEILMVAAECRGCSKLLRMADYYGDASFSFEELEGLREEIRSVRPDLSAHVWETLCEPFLELVDLALRERAKIEAIAD